MRLGQDQAHGPRSQMCSSPDTVANPEMFCIYMKPLHGVANAVSPEKLERSSTAK